MLKRNIAILIAGGLLSAQAGLAAAGHDTFPSNDTEVIWKPLPSQLKYFEQREADIKKEPVAPPRVSPSGNFFSPSGLSIIGVAGLGIIATRAIALQPRTLSKYLYETRPAEIAKDPTVLRGDSFPPSADDLYGKMLPAQVAYFEQRAASIQMAERSVVPLSH